MNKVIWVLVNCNSTDEAKSMGNSLLNQRFVSCFNVYNRTTASFFWPPKSGKVESAKGAALVLETFEDKYNIVKKEIMKMHSDKLPFVGYVEMSGVSEEFIDWMEGEIKVKKK